MDKKIISIVINGLKWFDKINGNTYHSGHIIVTFNDEVKEYKIPFQYGYGEQYVYSAFEALNKEGIIKESINVMLSPMKYCRDNNIKLIYNAVNVSRKKDCKI